MYCLLSVNNKIHKKGGNLITANSDVLLKRNFDSKNMHHPDDRPPENVFFPVDAITVDKSNGQSLVASYVHFKNNLNFRLKSF